MHQGKPYGLHVIGGKLTDRDEAFVSVTAKRFSNLKDLSSIDSSRMVYDLPDGGYIVVQDMGGNFRVIAHKYNGVSTDTTYGLAVDYVPMLLSGVVIGATPYKPQGVVLRMTEDTRKRFCGYDPNVSLPPKELALQRLNVEYNPKFNYFLPKYTGNRLFSQYHKQKATWYSGAMAEVVQAVGGYGLQDLSEIPNTKYEQQKFPIPKKTLNDMRFQIQDRLLPAYTGLPHRLGQYQYDYGFYDCNSVSFDSSGKPWLLRISSAGVHAMPLPMIPVTTTPLFREFIESVNDTEILHLLDRFGGMPSGESFPTKGWHHWVRAGVIIKVCDSAEFYRHRPLYDACGWAFNSSGSEGFNTCYSFDENNMRWVYAYKLKLNLAPVNNNGWLTGPQFPDNPEHRALVTNYIASIISNMTEDTDRERAIRYKIRRQKPEFLLACARQPDIKNIHFWENLVDEPIATHAGNMAQVSKGTLYWSGNNKKVFGNLKFPVITGEGCESFDLTIRDYEGFVLKCDTIVFGCYINDQLKVIKFFIDERGFQPKPESTFEKNMIVGKWESHEYGFTYLAGHLYTTDFDDRKPISSRETHIELKGEDLGYGNPLFHTPYIFQKWGLLSRSKYYSHERTTKVTERHYLNIATCVPVFSRDCILYAYKDGIEGGYKGEEMKRLSMQDPTTYGLWTYDPLWHYFGRDGKGEPRPKIGEYVYANYEPSRNYRPTDRNAFADSGNWYGVPESSFKDVSGICAKYTSRTGPHTAGGVMIGGEAPSIATYDIRVSQPPSESGFLSLSINVGGAVSIHKKIPESFYFIYSPIEDAAGIRYFYKESSHIACGTRKYAAINEYNSNRTPLHWGSTTLVENNSSPCFIGVINE